MMALRCMSFTGERLVKIQNSQASRGERGMVDLVDATSRSNIGLRFTNRQQCARTFGVRGKLRALTGKHAQEQRALPRIGRTAKPR